LDDEDGDYISTSKKAVLAWPSVLKGHASLTGGTSIRDTEDHVGNDFCT
jgi:hypothetical protein